MKQHTRFLAILMAVCMLSGPSGIDVWADGMETAELNSDGSSSSETELLAPDESSEQATVLETDMPQEIAENVDAVLSEEHLSDEESASEIDEASNDVEVQKYDEYETETATVDADVVTEDVSEESIAEESDSAVPSENSTSEVPISVEDGILLDAAEDTSGVAIDASNFPDANFRSYLAEEFDEDGDGYLDSLDLTYTTRIECAYWEIKDLKGIEFFTELTYLDCSVNEFASLDLSKNTKLSELYCSSGALTSIDLSANTDLVKLDCSYNSLKALDLSNNSQITSVDCSDNNLLVLDVNGASVLTELDCSSNKLSSLDVSQCTDLATVDCSYNRLTSLDMSANARLTHLDCEENSLRTLDVAGNSALRELICEGNKLTSLNVSSSAALTKLDCDCNEIAELNVDGNPILEFLSCCVNQLTALDTRQNSHLSYLDCSDNQLESLDISNNPAIINLVKNVTPTTWVETYYYASNSEKELFSFDSPIVLIYDGAEHPVIEVPYWYDLLNSSNGVYLEWASGSDVLKYEVYRTVKGTTNWKRIKTTSSLEYNDTTAKSGTEYSYKIRSVKGAVKSLFSPVKNIYFLKQPAISALKNTAKGSYLTWEKVAGATKYQVYRKIKGSSKWTKVKTTTALKYTDTATVSGKTYYYKVRAVRGSSVSAYSSAKTILFLNAPAISTIKNTSKGVKLTWKKISGAKKYQIYRRVKGTSKWVKVKTVTTLKYTDTKAKSKKTYYYRVRAINGSYVSAHSDSKKIKVA